MCTQQIGWNQPVTIFVRHGFIMSLELIYHKRSYCSRKFIFFGFNWCFFLCFLWGSRHILYGTNDMDPMRLYVVSFSSNKLQDSLLMWYQFLNRPLTRGLVGWFDFSKKEAFCWHFWSLCCSRGRICIVTQVSCSLPDSLKQQLFLFCLFQRPM